MGECRGPSRPASSNVRGLTPDTCIRQIEEITKTVKVDQLMLLQQFWAMPHEQTMKSIELFGKHIIPHFQKQAAAVTP